MPELEFDPVDVIAAGAVGVPGQRAFYIQASKDGQTVAVLVEKEQVAILSARIETLLDEVATQFPEVESEVESTDVVGDPVPLFRALAIGIGFDPIRQRSSSNCTSGPSTRTTKTTRTSPPRQPAAGPARGRPRRGRRRLARPPLPDRRPGPGHGPPRLRTVLAGRPPARCAATRGPATATSAPS